MAQLAEADLGMTERAFDQQARMPGQGPGMSPQPGDDALLVKFTKTPIEDPVKTKAQGRPIYMEVDFIEISRPGDRSSVVRRPASQNDKMRFPRHWDAYSLRNEEEYIEGTMLSEWPAINRAMVEELAYFNVRTVEQLSKIADSNTSVMRGLNTLKTRALAYLAATKDSAAGERINQELESRDAQIAMLTQQVNELKSAVATMQAGGGAAPQAAPAVVLAPSPVEAISPDALSMEPDDDGDPGLTDIIPPDALALDDDDPVVEPPPRATRRRRKAAD